MSVTYDKISTRDAFGIALGEAADLYPNLFAIGADTTKSMGFKPMIKTFRDFSAQIIQHEIDHCNGILI